MKIIDARVRLYAEAWHYSAGIAAMKDNPESSVVDAEL